MVFGRNTLHPLQSEHAITQRNPEVIEEYLQNEIQRGNIFGPFLPHTVPAVHINRFAPPPPPKKTSVRQMADLSFPEGKSVNDSSYQNSV